ncbi:MAG TPA: hypothetical protein DCR40_04220 [Prolixibacteraceae bacterium]|nr:hypothetical protein [Prolixibacteraceae bacterium]
MDNQKIIKVNDAEIHCLYDMELKIFKPLLFDISAISGLYQFYNLDEIKMLFKFLIADKYKESLKITAYENDLCLPEARFKLLRFLLITLGCHLILNENCLDNHKYFQLLRKFINNIYGFPFTDIMVLNLVIAEFPGYDLNIDLN